MTQMAVVGGPLEYIDNTIKTIKDIANKANKDPNNFKVILLAHLNVALDSKSQSTSTINEGQRFPFTGTIDQIGDDIENKADEYEYRSYNIWIQLYPNR
jgi:hypothetical protein